MEKKVRRVLDAIVQFAELYLRIGHHIFVQSVSGAFKLIPFICGRAIPLGLSWIHDSRQTNVQGFVSQLKCQATGTSARNVTNYATQELRN
jgi:hypothetical protein